MSGMSLNNISFKNTVLTVTALTFIVLAASVAYVSSLNAANEIANGIVTEGRQLCQNLAKNSVVPLLYQSKTGAEAVGSPVFSSQHVTEVRVNTFGNTLFQASNESHVQNSYPQVLQGEQSKVIETKQGWYFSELVLSENQSSNDIGLLGQHDNGSGGEVLGYVNIALSKRHLDASRDSIFINNFLMAMAAAVALLLVLYAALSRVTRPIERLSALMERGMQGDYEQIRETRGPREIVEMSQAFNKMIHSIREREQNLSLTLDSIIEAVIVCDRDGMIIRVNPEARELVGDSHHELVGKNINEIIMLRELGSSNLIECPVCEALENARPVIFNEPVLFTGMDDREHTVTCSVAPLKQPDSSEVNGAVLVLNDITDKYKQDEILRRTQKLDALGKMTGGIAHDYNNMLNIALGYAQLIQLRLNDGELAKEHVSHIIHACERAAGLTKKLLTFSKNTSVKKEDADLNGLLTAQQDILEKTTTARIKLVLDLQDGLERVHLTPSEFEDAIVNMSINAMHAMEDGGTLTISTQNRVVTDEEAESYNVSPGRYVSVSVSDTGCGIKREVINQVFDPFFSTKGNMGTGLGLSQVHSFVKRSNGLIKIYSEVGHGTQITMCFPVCVTSNNEASEESADFNIADLSGDETILVVDDEPALRRMATEILERSGYTVYTAENGASALQLLGVKDIDLVLSDIIMPGMDGYKLEREINRYYPNVKVQLASGFTDVRVENDKLRNTSILHKPFNHHMLLSTVRERLDHS